LFKHIIVAVDDSADSYKAAEMGLQLAKVFTSTVTFTYVVTEDYIKTVIKDTAVMRKAGDPFDSMLLDEARTEQTGNEVFSKIIKMAKKQAHPYIDTKVLNGNPSAELVNEICTGDYDLAIVGRQGASKAQKSIIGDVVEPVIRLCTIPTLIVSK